MVTISFRRFFSLAAVVLLCFSLGTGLVFADDELVFETEATTSSEVPESSNVSESISFSVVGPVEPNDTNGFKAVLLELLGDYDPIIAEYSYTNSNGYISYVREVQPDYIWMISAAIFIIVLYCAFRFLGGLFKKWQK